MRRQDDLERELATRLRDEAVAGEAEARERSWGTVRAAHAARPVARPVRRWGRWLAALAAGAAVVLVSLTPAGADLRGWISDAIDPGSTNPKPSLTALPGGGTVLVESEAGATVVNADGSRRFLGRFSAASLSPRARNVAVGDGRTLSAIHTADGDLRWSLSSGVGRVSDPSWSQDLGFRVAYVSDGELRIVAGDGTGDRRFAAASPVAPAWRGASDRVLAYVDEGGTVRIADIDVGTRLAGFETPGVPRAVAFSASGERLLVRSTAAVSTMDADGRNRLEFRAGGELVAASFIGASDRRLAVVSERTDDSGATTSAVSVVAERAGRLVERRLFRTAGPIAGLAAAPAGEWLLVGWKEADQWLFLEPQPGGAIRAVDNISAQFGPGEAGAPFPVPVEWCCQG